jgi:hypothetical protein
MRGRPLLFRPWVVRLAVPRGAGVYVLGTLGTSRGSQPLYVGRSDIDLRERLSAHELMCTFQYFRFSICRSAREAFFEECRLWHSFGNLHNLIHPDSPSGSGLSCPYCAAVGQFGGAVERYRVSGRHSAAELPLLAGVRK